MRRRREAALPHALPLLHRVTAATAVVSAGLLAGCAPTVADPGVDPPGLVVETDAVAAAPPVPPASPTASDALAELGRAAVARAVPDAAPPAHLAIPAIGVDTPTIGLDLTAAAAEVPESFHVAGWYRQTRTPGTRGPAVVVGHVGSRDGPGVFAHLDRLRPGDEVLVTDVDGVVRTFVVDRGALVDKHDRPPEVFGWVGDRPELRLITCGGDFDPGTGHHVSNYVIWAHEVTT